MMRCAKAKRFMMDQLFGEITPAGAAQLEFHLEKCPACRKEWQAVQESHVWMKHLPDTPVPYPLEQAILHLAQTGVHESTSHLWRWSKPLAAAAVFVLLLCASLEYFRKGTKPAGTELSSTERYAGNKVRSAQQELPTLKVEEPKPVFFAQEKISEVQTDKPSSPSLELNQRITAGTELAEPDKPVTNFAVQTGAVAVQAGDFVQVPQPTAVMLAGRELKAKGVTTIANEKEAEDLFRTGLKLYNRAFTKVGDERNAMLKSAIVFLRDGIQRYYTHRLWVSLSLILIADSHRALGETEAAVQAYQQMIDQFPELEEYCKHARSSIITLLSQNTQTLPKAERALLDFNSLYPKSPEFAELAFAVADQIRTASPQQALSWYRRISKQTKENDPAKDKAERISESLEEQLRQENLIKDWWLVGPMERDSQLADLPGFSVKNFAIKTNLRSIGFGQKPVSWKRPFSGQYGVVDITSVFGQNPKNSSVFAITYIYSPVKQEISLLAGSTDGFKIWVNGEPVFSDMNFSAFQRDTFSVNTSLRKGWNPVIVKTYHLNDQPEWKFSLQITDLDGHIIPDLIMDPERKAVKSD